jgi:hypothetical protein
MSTHAGGCLCGALRYATEGEPARIVYCHCRFCQRATGSAYLVELMYAKTHFRLTQGRPATYDLTSAGSGKRVTINFCSTCGTKLFLDLARVPDDIGLYAGTLDDPNWWTRDAAKSKHIFYDVAHRGVVIAPHVPVFREHVVSPTGEAQTCVMFDAPHIVD